MPEENNTHPIQQHYESNLTRVPERQSHVQKFIDMLHNETTLLTSPASTKYHLNMEGGLLQHSAGVTETLLQIKEGLAPDINDESCIINGLFHDVGKVGMPGKPYYMPEGMMVSDRGWLCCCYCTGQICGLRR
jgi:23S rRNA maturation-related 3'-5' exoribonuclease YhaM